MESFHVLRPFILLPPPPPSSRHPPTGKPPPVEIRQISSNGQVMVSSLGGRFSSINGLDSPLSTAAGEFSDTDAGFSSDSDSEYLSAGESEGEGEGEGERKGAAPWLGREGPIRVFLYEVRQALTRTEGPARRAVRNLHWTYWALDQGGHSTAQMCLLSSDLAMDHHRPALRFFLFSPPCHVTRCQRTTWRRCFKSWAWRRACQSPLTSRWRTRWWP